MRTHKISWVMGVLSVFIFLFACSTVKPDYKEARRLDTIAAYQEFLRTHPQSEFTEAAHTRIDAINFEKAKAANTVLAYEQFMDSSNSDLFKNYANQFIIKVYEEDYKKTKEINTLEAYETYLKKYPKSIYSEDCTMRIESFIWNRTIKENTALSYYKYLNNCGTCGRHDQEAGRRFKTMIKLGLVIDLAVVQNRVKKILSRKDLVIVQKSPKGSLTRTGSMSLAELMEAEDVLVSIARDVQAIGANDLETGNFESVEKLRLKDREPGHRIHTMGFRTIIIYPEESGPTDVIFIADEKAYLFQETGSRIH